VHPYENLPEQAYWRTAIADRHQFSWENIWERRFAIEATDEIASAGSCFAQHIRHHLEVQGFRYLDLEPQPSLMSNEAARRYGYGLFSARYQNIYTAKQLHQLFTRAFGDFIPVDQAWESDGRWFDPFRPSVEPGGFASREELELSTHSHLGAVREMFLRTNVFIFTLGLTEAWRDRKDGAVYPTCPGTIAGTFDPDRHEFVNFNHSETWSDMRAFLVGLRTVNPRVRVLLTVSPVPLTATASGRHVLVATMASKSTLRSVAETIYQRYSYVDYFPAYELVASAAGRGVFFEPNLRKAAQRRRRLPKPRQGS